MKRIWSNIPRLSRFSWVDAVVAVFVFALLYFLVKLGTGMGVPFSMHDQPHISLAWWMLPYYAGRSLLRMFIAFAGSLVFTFIYGRIAARYRAAEMVMIPLLDILQSVPVVGFLAATITGFIALFPHSLFGVELASIFTIFTGQVWNMTFSFYYSSKSLPRELTEASNMIGLDGYTRFTRLELPFSMIGLVWNSMMSFGGGWFFLTYSESITVLNRTIQLPGIGSYMATAMQQGNIGALVAAIITMVILIVLVDQLFWRPIVAWSQKFKVELSNSGDDPTSWFLQFLRRSRLAGWLADDVFGAVFKAVDNFALRMAKRRRISHRPVRSGRGRRIFGMAAAICLAVLAVYYGAIGLREILHIGWRHIGYVCLLGLYTLLRVFASTALACLWTVPVGVAIGSSPRASRIAQPLVQVASSFPANMLFPLVTVLYLQWHVSLQIGAIPFMMLGTQWYILFSVIAGSMAIPNDLKEATKVLGLRGRERWKRLYLPAIFPYVVTGCITASGGAWNASILAEVVSWHHRTLFASGLGSYIVGATASGRWPDIILGIAVMAALVTLVNRTLWRPLYAIADKRFRLEASSS